MKPDFYLFAKTLVLAGAVYLYSPPLFAQSLASSHLMHGQEGKNSTNAGSSGVSLLSAGETQLVNALDVSGRVSDDKGQGIPGVNVLQKGTTNGTITDPEGKYALSVTDGNSTLVFSYIGYVSQEVPVNNRTSVDISLVPDIKALEEIVVVGYGTQSKGTVTGAISDIKAADLVRTPAVTTSGLLVGKIPGITARQTDARPGGVTNIQVRNMGNPLYVIDGVPADAQQFNNLGSNDIESVSILKDASAAIYGLRASNGVVLVTTKKGKVGTRINLNGYYGLQNFTRFPQPANAYQHMRALAESDQNRGIATNLTSEELSKWQAGTEKNYRSFDYYDYILRPNVPQYNMNANLSGGAENINYYVSVSHLNQDALIKDFNFNRTNIQANIDAKLVKGLSVGTQISGRIEDRHQTGVPGLDDYFNPLLSVFTMWPTERPYANDNPNYINQTHNINVNPATYAEEVTGYADEIWRAFKGNFTAQYDFKFGLTAKGTYSFGYSAFNFEGFEYTYNAYTYDEATDSYNVVVGGGNQNPWREKRRRNLMDRFAQFQLNYNKQFGDHGVAAVAAYERQDNENTYLIIHTVPPNNYVPIMRFENQDFLLDEWTIDARAGYIGRFNYNYKQKYLVEVLGRYDGSFLFAPGKRFGFFPGVSAGWRISEEPFLKDIAGGFLDDLKIRVSYGRTGSDRLPYNNPDNLPIVSPFSYTAGYTYGSRNAIFNGGLVTGVAPRGLPITTLSWINNISKNIGIDFSFFQNKLSGQFDVFERKRTGLPGARYDVLLPSEVGYTLPNENLNSDAHRGVEGALIFRNKTGPFDYSLGINATVSRLRILEIYKPRVGNSWDAYRNTTQSENRWADINFGYQIVGQFQSQEEIDNYTVDNDGQGNRTQLPGDLIYKDVNGDGHINTLDERPIGYAQGANPYMSFGINGSVGYKGFNLLFDFAGGSMQTFQRQFEMQIPFQNNGTSPAYMFEDRWHQEDPFDNNSRWISGTYPAIRKDNPNHVNFSRKNDFWVTNVSYIRLRNIELGYTFPASLVSKFGMAGFRIYTNASNLFSIDNVRRLEIDPEITSASGLVYPQQKLLNFGFDITF